ncbi:MAG: response regulator [Epsilonproteobacteria bacterium]|nr:hypothetical protein [Campylobacterota bacterium]NPA56254.1 response regulator [Campylobacterota bacterium]
MKILIVENEIYLAQSIASKLSEKGYTCEIAASVHDALKEDEVEVVLLSTNMSGQNFYPVIERYRESIIILLVSYISQDTVSDPLQAGANDYILKPFMIEELIRKIEHFIEYQRLKAQNECYKSYIDYALQGLEVGYISIKEPLPLFLKTNYQRYADAYAFQFADLLGETFRFYSLAEKGSLNRIRQEKERQLLYITDYQSLKRSEREQFLQAVEGKRALISTTEPLEEEIPYRVVELKSDNKIYDINDILTIDEYVKYVIINYQNKFPDTILSKKLGISRKSLWEKRKKYEIFKKR